MEIEEGDADFCPRCGAPLERELRASNGGEPIEEEVLFDHIPNGQSFHGDFHGSKTDGGYPMGSKLPITRAVIYLHTEGSEPHGEFEPEPVLSGGLGDVDGFVSRETIDQMNERTERRYKRRGEIQ